MIKNKIKTSLIVMLVPVALVAVLCVGGLFPVQFAISEQDLTDKTDYILVEVQKSTISQWIATGDKNGPYEILRDVRIIGKEPSGFNYDVEVGGNVYVCYGEYEGIEMLGDSTETGTYYVFNATGWDIIAPVRRKGILPLPESYLCLFDINR